MARKCVERKQRDVESEDERADTDAEVAVEEEGVNGVVPKKNDEQNREVKEIAMDILEDERKSGFAAIVAARRFTDRAGGGIEEKGAIERLAVVVAGGAKAEGASKDQNGGREGPPMMIGIDERRIERRKVGTPRVELPLKGAKRGVDAETAHHNDDR